MLGNRFKSANTMPAMLAKLTDAEAVHHTCGTARLAEQLNPRIKSGEKTYAALELEFWDYVVLQEMSNALSLAKRTFFKECEATL